MKRDLTFIGGILSTVSNAILFVFYIVGFTTIISLLGGKTPPTSFTLIVLLMLMVGVIALTLSAYIIYSYNKNCEEFKKYKVLIIIGIILNFINLIFPFFSPSWLILLSLALLVGNIMILVDLCNEEKRASLAAVNKDKEETPVENKIEQAFSENKNQKEKVTKANDSLLELEKKLIKLNEMKNQGLIDEEEFSEIKKSYIKNNLNN